MTKMQLCPEGFSVVDRVTETHANVFMERLSSDEFTIDGAVGETGVITWEEVCGCADLDDCSHWLAYLTASREIEKRFLELIGPTLRAKFIEAAEEVLHGVRA